MSVWHFTELALLRIFILRPWYKLRTLQANEIWSNRDTLIYNNTNGSPGIYLTSAMYESQRECPGTSIKISCSVKKSSRVRLVLTPRCEGHTSGDMSLCLIAFSRCCRLSYILYVLTATYERYSSFPSSSSQPPFHHRHIILSATPVDILQTIHSRKETYSSLVSEHGVNLQRLKLK